MLQFTARPMAGAAHWDEVVTKASYIIQPQITNAVNAALGSIHGKSITIKGDIQTGISVSATMGGVTHLDDLFGEKNIEKAVVDVLDFNYGRIIERASNEVAAVHPEDTL